MLTIQVPALMKHKSLTIIFNEILDFEYHPGWLLSLINEVLVLEYHPGWNIKFLTIILYEILHFDYHPEWNVRFVCYHPKWNTTGYILTSIQDEMLHFRVSSSLSSLKYWILNTIEDDT